MLDVSLEDRGSRDHLFDSLAHVLGLLLRDRNKLACDVLEGPQKVEENDNQPSDLKRKQVLKKL